MSKIRTYIYSNFAKSEEDAIQRFLHHAHDHMLASQQLLEKPMFLDSSAYLCNMAFELLLKAAHLAENGQFKGIHNLTNLHDELSKKIFTKKDMPLINVIDKYSHVRYPIDHELHGLQKKLRLNGRAFAMDEIGTEDLERAGKLFFTTWEKLKRRKKFKPCIEKIHRYPFKKGNRILMRKKRNH